MWLDNEPTQTGRRAAHALFLPKKLRDLEMRLKGTQQSELLENYRELEQDQV